MTTLRWGKVSETWVLVMTWPRTHLHRSRSGWRNPGGRGTRSSMRDRTWHDIKPRSKRLLSHHAAGAFWVPPLPSTGSEPPRSYPPASQNSKSKPPQSRGKVKVKRRWETNGGGKTNLFLNVFVVQKDCSCHILWACTFKCLMRGMT